MTVNFRNSRKWFHVWCFQIRKAINTDRQKSVGYLRHHDSKSKEVHRKIMPVGWCFIRHSPYGFKKSIGLYFYKITAVHELKPSDCGKLVLVLPWFLYFSWPWSRTHFGHYILRRYYSIFLFVGVGVYYQSIFCDSIQ